MKKLFSLLLVLFAVSVTGCNNNEKPSESETEPEVTETETTTPSQSENESEEESVETTEYDLKNYTVYVNSPNWDKAYLYTWTTAPKTGWPGDEMTLYPTDNGAKVYSYTLDVTAYDNIIFNNGTGSQTGDLTMPEDADFLAGKNCFDFHSNTWINVKEAKSTVDAPYYIRGTMTSWGDLEEYKLTSVSTDDQNLSAQYHIECTFAAQDEWKIYGGPNAAWFGNLEAAGAASNDQMSALPNDGNIVVAVAGTYDIYLKIGLDNKHLIYVSEAK